MPPRLNLYTARSLSLLRSTSQCHHATLTSSSSPSSSARQRSYKKRCSSLSPSWLRISRTSTCRSFAPAQQCGAQRRLNSSSAKPERDTESPLPEQDADAGAGAAGGREGGGKEPWASEDNQLPHASEEAAEIAKIMEKKACGVGGDVGGPELEQGTPVVDILKRDKDAVKNMPKVLRDQLKPSGSGSGGDKGTRSFSTSARLSQQQQQDAEQEPTKGKEGSVSEASMAQFAEMMAAASEGKPLQEEMNNGEAQQEGLKFDAPTLPLPRTEHMRSRYDPVVDHFTKMIMWHGKLAQAQKHMSMVLDILRTASPPTLDTRLLPNPGNNELPLNPIAYLTLVVDSVAPLLKIRQQKGAAGGGKALPIPRPLSVRQRRRIAIQWIVTSSEKRRDPELPKRLAQEIIAVAEGRSGIWARRAQLHKEGTAARVNVNWSPGRTMGRKKF